MRDGQLSNRREQHGQRSLNTHETEGRNDEPYGSCTTHHENKEDDDDEDDAFDLDGFGGVTNDHPHADILRESAAWIRDMQRHREHVFTMRMTNAALMEQLVMLMDDDSDMEEGMCLRDGGKDDGDNNNSHYETS